MHSVRMKYDGLRVGQQISCRYPKSGNGDILVDRVGHVEYLGVGPNGNYFTIDMGDKGKRNLSQSRVVDLTLISE